MVYHDAPEVDFSEFFNSSLYSDLTIRYGNKEIAAHKVIVAPASDHFKGEISDGLQGAPKSEIRLQDDPPAAVEGMIAYIYGLQFDGQSTFHKTEFIVAELGTEETEGMAEALPFVKYQVDLFVVACKYQVSELVRSILSHMPNMIIDLALAPELPLEGLSRLREIAKYVYETYREKAERLRGFVADAFARLVFRLGDEGFEQVKHLLVELPGLGIDIIRAQAALGKPFVAEGKRKKPVLRDGLLR